MSIKTYKYLENNHDTEQRANRILAQANKRRLEENKTNRGVKRKSTGASCMKDNKRCS